MVFDNIPRPIQINPALDNLNMQMAGQIFVDRVSSAERVKGVEASEDSKNLENKTGTHQESADQMDAQQDREQFLSREDRQYIIELAKMRGLLNFTLDEDKTYRLKINPHSGLVELIEILHADTGKVLLTLSNEDLQKIAQHTDHSGLFKDELG